MATEDDLIDRTYKVGRVLDDYGIREFAGELERLWTGEVGEAHSLRELATVLNRRLLRAAMVDAGLNPLEGEVENAYRLLTSDEVSAGMRTQQRQELADQGVDVDALEGDFVTHQAVHTYLRTVLGAEKQSPTPENRQERDREALTRLQNRTEAVTRSTVERLRDTDRLELGEFDVFVDVSVYCRDCDTQRSVEALFETGGCDCAPRQK